MCAPFCAKNLTFSSHGKPFRHLELKKGLPDGMSGLELATLVAAGSTLPYLLGRTIQGYQDYSNYNRVVVNQPTTQPAFLQAFGHAADYAGRRVKQYTEETRLANSQPYDPHAKYRPQSFYDSRRIPRPITRYYPKNGPTIAAMPYSRKPRRNYRRILRG